VVEAEPGAPRSAVGRGWAADALARQDAVERPAVHTIEAAVEQAKVARLRELGAVAAQLDVLAVQLGAPAAQLDVPAAQPDVPAAQLGVPAAAGLEAQVPVVAPGVL
jgi:hypothetical protein